VFTIQNFIGSHAELEPSCAYMFLSVTGVPALILLVVATQLIDRHHHAG
jgi:hypothetical protein